MVYRQFTPDSSAIETMAYNGEEFTLVIKFQSENIRVYDEVKPKTWYKFIDADSIGRWYTENIKGEYQSRHPVMEEREQVQGQESSSSHN